MSRPVPTLNETQTRAEQKPGVPAIEAIEVVKTYPGGHGKPPVTALDGLTLAAVAGSVLALLGPNGAGKSTAVKILSTLSRPSSGSARIAGLDVTTSQDAVRRCIGLVTQKPSSDPMATGRENILLAARIQGLSRRDAKQRTAALLDRFELTDAADRLAKTYSGGMARKLDVALGLVHRPKVLFLDEPTTGLDPQARADMWDEIARLAGEQEMTVLLTTHYLDEADHLADQVAIVDRGCVVAEGTPDELKGQLHGDTVHVELESAEAAVQARGRLERIDGLREISCDLTTVRARADSGARAVPAVLAALESAQLSVVSVTIARPSLDDVYLRHAGRAFEGVGR